MGKYRRKKNMIPRGRGTQMLSVKDISEKYDFHPNTIRAWINRDRIRHIKHGPGGKFFIRQFDVERFIEIWYPNENIDKGA